MTTAAADRPRSSFELGPQDTLNDLRMSDKALPLYNKVKQFIRDVVERMCDVDDLTVDTVLGQWLRHLRPESLVARHPCVVDADNDSVHVRNRILLDERERTAAASRDGRKLHGRRKPSEHAGAQGGRPRRGD